MNSVKITKTKVDVAKIYNKYRDLVLSLPREKFVQCKSNYGYYIKKEFEGRGRCLEVSLPSIIRKYMEIKEVENVENFTVLDIGSGVPYVWEILYKLYGIRNFVGCDFMLKETFEKLCKFPKSINYEYCDQGFEGFLADNPQAQFSLVIDSIAGIQDRYKSLVSEEGILVVNYMNGYCVEKGKCDLFFPQEEYSSHLKEAQEKLSNTGSIFYYGKKPQKRKTK